jgi:hypothetical protein
MRRDFRQGRQIVRTAMAAGAIKPPMLVVIDINANEGPAITSIEYKIDPKTAEEFLQAMKEMK